MFNLAEHWLYVATFAVIALDYGIVFYFWRK